MSVDLLLGIFGTVLAVVVMIPPIYYKIIQWLGCRHLQRNGILCLDPISTFGCRFCEKHTCPKCKKREISVSLADQMCKKCQKTLIRKRERTMRATVSIQQSNSTSSNSSHVSNPLFDCYSSMPSTDNGDKFRFGDVGTASTSFQDNLQEVYGGFEAVDI